MTYRRPVVSGLLGASAMASFYVLVLVAASGTEHLLSQVRVDWPWLALILAGFGTQVGMLVELRRRHRAARAATATATGGAGAGGVGMVACCAHHIADLLPFLGATGAAAFLLDYRVAFMVAGIGMNALGIGLTARRLRAVPAAVSHEETACAV